MRRDEDAEIRLFLAAVGALPGVHVQRIHVLKVRLPSGAWLMSTTPGTSDVVVVVQGHVVWTEWKSSIGKERESQERWRCAVTAAGGTVWLCRDHRQAIRDLAAIATGPTRALLLAAANPA